MFSLVQGIPICRPLKEGEAYCLKTFRSVKVGAKLVVEDGVYEHRCLEVDDHEVEHIEAKCVEGTIKRGNEEPESTKGESYNYFQNSRGQRFEYEEIKSTLKEDPLEFVSEQIHSKLRDFTVLPGETWKDKSSHTEYTVVAGQPKQFMKTECIQVIRKGKFTNGISGAFMEDSWYRVSDGQLMYQQTTGDEIKSSDLETIQFLERLEFLPVKKSSKLLF